MLGGATGKKEVEVASREELDAIYHLLAGISNCCHIDGSLPPRLSHVFVQLHEFSAGARIGGRAEVLADKVTRNF